MKYTRTIITAIVCLLANSHINAQLLLGEAVGQKPTSFYSKKMWEGSANKEAFLENTPFERGGLRLLEKEIATNPAKTVVYDASTFPFLPKINNGYDTYFKENMAIVKLNGQSYQIPVEIKDHNSMADIPERDLSIIQSMVLKSLTDINVAPVRIVIKTLKYPQTSEINYHVFLEPSAEVSFLELMATEIENKARVEPSNTEERKIIKRN